MVLYKFAFCSKRVCTLKPVPRYCCMLFCEVSSSALATSFISAAEYSSSSKPICCFTKSILVMANWLSISCCIVNTPAAVALPSLMASTDTAFILFFGRISVTLDAGKASLILIEAAFCTP